MLDQMQTITHGDVFKRPCSAQYFRYKVDSAGVLYAAILRRSFWSCYVQNEQGRIEKLDKTLFLAKVG